MFLQQLKIWQRLCLLIALGILALLALNVLAYKTQNRQHDDLEAMVERTEILRLSQRIIIRAQDARAQVMLGLQHNPGNGEILRLHDHALSRHLDLIATNLNELDEALIELKRHFARTPELSPGLIDALEQDISRFRSEGMAFAQQKLTHGQFLDANQLLLTKTNPSFEALKRSAQTINEQISQLATTDAKNALAAGERNALINLLLALTTSLLLGGLGYLIARSITRQLGGEPTTAMQRMDTISRGDLRPQGQQTAAGSVLEALDHLTQNLNQTVRQIQTQSEAVHSHASVIAVNARQVTQGTETEAEAVTEIASALEQMSFNIFRLAEMSRETEALAEQTHQSSLAGEERVRETSVEIGQIARDVQQAWEQVLSLDSSAVQISDIAKVIKEIAGQTNLLALNAAIEAARAGESGRGFAVVADAVGKLAERTALATGDIETMIATIQEKTGSIARDMNAMLPQVERGNHAAHQAALSLAQISTASERILASARNSARATGEQQHASSTIAEKIEEISRMVEETAVAMRETSGKAGETNILAGKLQQLVDRFSV